MKQNKAKQEENKKPNQQLAAYWKGNCAAASLGEVKHIKTEVLYLLCNSLIHSWHL